MKQFVLAICIGYGTVYAQPQVEQNENQSKVTLKKSQKQKKKESYQQRHLGFYAHFSLAGIGATVTRENSSDIDNFSKSSLGVQVNGSMGYAIFENFILGAMVQLARLNPGSESTSLSDIPDPTTFFQLRKLTTIRPGVFLQYYFMPANVYLAAAPLFSRTYITSIRFESDGKTTRTVSDQTEWGRGLYAALGYEAWLEKDVAIGFHLFAIYSQGQKQEIKDNELVIGLGMGFTLN